MTTDSGTTIESCPQRLIVEAIGMLAAAQQPRGCSALARAVDQAGEGDWSGLWVARGKNDELLGAIWVQPLPGEYALIWPPHDSCPALDALLMAASAWCDQQGFCVSQLLATGEPGEPGRAVLERGGFPFLSTMLYLQGDGRPEGAVSDEIEWNALAPDDINRFDALFRATEEKSLDYPELHGVRPTRAVLDGFRAQGELDPALWSAVRVDGADAGLLIMAAHPGTDFVELVYMGVASAFRGRGIGRALVERALACAHQRGCRMLVALDGRNRTAQRIYAAAGLAMVACVDLHARVGSAAPVAPSAPS